MKRVLSVFLLTIATISIVHAAAAQPQAPFRIVIHPENGTESATSADVTNWMLKKVGRWPDGTRVDPVDQQPNAPARAAFSEDVLGRDVRSVLRYWQRQVFSARSLPPPEVDSDSAVIEYVRQNRGGIGYVSASATLEGVKQLSLTSRAAGRGGNS